MNNEGETRTCCAEARGTAKEKHYGLMLKHLERLVQGFALPVSDGLRR